jgi:hypothetical protein
MQKEQAIAAAQLFAEHHPNVEQFFVTTDGQVHINVQDAVNKAVELNGGNPIVIEVVTADFETLAATKDDSGLMKLTKDEAIEKAKAQVDAAIKLVEEKTANLETAEPNKKGAATIALNKAKTAVENAKTALAFIEEEKTV